MNSFKGLVIRRLVLPYAILFILAAAVVGGPSYYLYGEVERLKQELQVVHRKFQTLYGDVRFLLDQYRLYKKYGDAYFNLEQRGLVTDVKRARWVDELLLFSYAYMYDGYRSTFQPYKPLQNVSVARYRVPSKLFYRNPMVVNAKLPLDVDFLRFHQYLHEHITPFSYVSNCELFSDQTLQQARAGERVVPSLLSSKHQAGNVTMRCTYDIITAQPRKRKTS